MTNPIQKGIRFTRTLFSGKPKDSLSILHEHVEYTSGGKKGRKLLQELRHVSLDQSFLGLFGKSVNLFFENDTRVLIRGLDKDQAQTHKQVLNRKLHDISVTNAKKSLAESTRRIEEAWQCLNIDHYISAWHMQQWEEYFSDLRFLCILDDDVLADAGSGEITIKCRSALQQPQTWRATHNDRWVAKELVDSKEFLDSIGSNQLTVSQKEAILRHDNRVLAVAGAGTGKTTTVIGKVIYLLQNGTYQPEDILLLSFSTGTVEELQQRIARTCDNKIKVSTFHSLGLEIVTKATGRKPAVFEQKSAADLGMLISNELVSMLKEKSCMAKLLEFLAYCFYPTRALGSFQSKTDFDEHVSSHDIRTLKSERVKSNQEAQIANWLFLHGIEYIYEAEYKGVETGSETKRVYKPDFYLPRYNIYIEHFGIDRDGNTAHWIPKEEYTADMQWKRALHKSNGTTLIETYSYQAFEGVLNSCLQSQLELHDVSLQPIKHEELVKLKELKFRVRSTAKLLATTLTLFKGDRLTLPKLKETIKTRNDRPTRRRELRFLSVFTEILKRYERILSSKGEIDFGDMITEAARYVETGKYKSPYKVIIVDEFQDISRGRAWFMNALLEQVDDARLLCVGDDWQSIYRFTGSDISLMTGYESQWPEAVRIDMSKTFRFNDKIQEVSARFITKNPMQLKKQIFCAESRLGPAVHITDKAISEIISLIKSESPDASIFILNRYNFNSKGSVLDIEDEGVLGIKHFTIHMAKGKEADYIILDNVNSGRYGFPSEMMDDPIISLFLANADNFKNAEERRLLYVAITRARKDVWLRVGDGSPSCFIEELASDPVYADIITDDRSSAIPAHTCPKCGSSMVSRKNRKSGSLFLSCKNYPRCHGTLPGCPACGKSIPERIDDLFQCTVNGCMWSSRPCPRCKIGFAEKRTGKHGDFVGCSMFSVTDCRWIERR